MLDYYDRPEISHSDLKLIDKSLAHYYNKGLHVPTPEMIEGSAFHCYFLEPEKFNSLYAIKPEGLSLATKEGKEWKKENESLITVNGSWFEPAKKAILEHPLSSYLDGKAEQEYYFKYNGVNCRSKLDLFNENLDLIIDLKTIADASKAENRVKFDYASQAYFYKKAVGNDPDFYFLFVEKSEPYGVKWICPTAETLAYGRDFVNRAIEKYKIGGYTGYSEGLIYV